MTGARSRRPLYSDPRDGASRVPVTVRQAFLHHPEYGGLDILRHAPDIRRRVEIDSYLATIHKSFHVPTESG